MDEGGERGLVVVLEAEMYLIKDGAVAGVRLLMKVNSGRRRAVVGAE